MQFNWDLLTADLNAMGVSESKLSNAIGHGTNYVQQLKNGGVKVTEDHAKAIAKVLFKDEDRYILEDTPEGQNYTAFLQEMIKNLSVMRAQNEEIIGHMKTFWKEFDTFRKTTSDQNGETINKLTGITTQILKCRSQLERGVQ